MRTAGLAAVWPRRTVAPMRTTPLLVLPPESGCSVSLIVLVIGPVAVIGVRGTDLLVEVTPAGDTRVAVIEGQAIITPLRPGGQLTPVNPNNEGKVDNGGIEVKIDAVPGDASGSSEKMTAWFDSDGSLGNGGGGPPSGLSGQAQIRTLQGAPTPPVITPPPTSPAASPPPRMPGMKM